VPKVCLVTLGCPKNAVDSEGLGGMLAAAGHEVVLEVENAEVALVNTCGFIDPARRETVEDVLELAELKSEGSLKGLVLTGCLVARSAVELAEALPEVDALVDFAAYPRIAEIVDGAAAGSLEQRIHGDPGRRFDPAWWDAAMASAPRLAFGRRPWAYLKIAEGCDRGCTFCSIPLMRGKLRSRPLRVIEDEARRLVDLGTTELCLVSQDSVMWGRDTGEGDLVRLLARLEVVPGLERIRLMYLHPQGLGEELIEAVLSSSVVCDYFDLSLQHVSPGVLRAMGRWGGRERFEGLIERIRARDPRSAIRSTFILGFPGESEDDARAVEDFVAGTDLDWVGVFQYSLEEGTRSFELPGRIPEVVARARTDRVASAAQLTMERRARSLRGTRLTALVERFDLEERAWIGRSHREAPEVDGEIRLLGCAGGVGDYVELVVTGSEGADLVGRCAGSSVA
jgi:ribosomal protein S12 methylthiotransferase